jgi:hypothetical protein
MRPSAISSVEAMTPLAIEVALSVQQELATRHDEADRLRRQHVERARYEADLAQRRFLKVDPDNRLVADALEADWNAKAARPGRPRRKPTNRRACRSHRLLPRMPSVRNSSRWRATSHACGARSTHRHEGEEAHAPAAHLRTLRSQRENRCTSMFASAGGAVRSLDLPLPKSCVRSCELPMLQVVAGDRQAHRYLHRCEKSPSVFNERGVRTVVCTPWTAARIGRLRHAYQLVDRRSRLLAQGLLTAEDVAVRYGVVVSTVHLWRRRGLLRAHPVNDKGDYLYEIPSEDLPAKHAHKREYHVPASTTPSRAAGGAV